MVRKTLAERVWEKFNHRCFICGRDESHGTRQGEHMDLHHINGDDSDDRRDNLVLLCTSCHKMVHRRDDPPYQAFHRALPKSMRNQNGDVAECDPKPLSLNLEQSRISQFIDTGLNGHRYRKMRSDEWFSDGETSQ